MFCLVRIYYNWLDLIIEGRKKGCATEAERCDSKTEGRRKNGVTASTKEILYCRRKGETSSMKETEC